MLAGTLQYGPASQYAATSGISGMPTTTSLQPTLWNQFPGTTLPATGNFSSSIFSSNLLLNSNFGIRQPPLQGIWGQQVNPTPTFGGLGGLYAGSLLYGAAFNQTAYNPWGGIQQPFWPGAVQQPIQQPVWGGTGIYGGLGLGALYGGGAWNPFNQTAAGIYNPWGGIQQPWGGIPQGPIVSAINAPVPTSYGNLYPGWQFLPNQQIQWPTTTPVPTNAPVNPWANFPWGGIQYPVQQPIQQPVWGGTGIFGSPLYGAAFNQTAYNPWGGIQQPIWGAQQPIWGAQQPIWGAQQPIWGAQQPIWGAQQPVYQQPVPFLGNVGSWATQGRQGRR